MKIFIDCDTGIDDSIALLFALKRPDIEIVGITTSCGNTTARQAAENTLRIIKLSGFSGHIPVAAGAEKPLVGEYDGPVVDVHGDNGIGNMELPETDQKPEEEDAADMIIRMVHENPHELTLVTLGRMTNIALALEKDPELPKLVKNMVAMGGSVYACGNVTPVCEANIAGDPEAADKVLLAGFDLTMVGLDVTTKVCLSSDYIEKLKKYCAEGNEAIVRYISGALDYYYGYYRSCSDYLEHSPLHDPLAMLVTVDPSLVTMQKRRARVECGGTMCRGMIVTDMREHPMDAPFTTFCFDVDGRRAIEELFSVFTA